VPKLGETLSGRDAVRGVLARLIDGKAQLWGKLVRVVAAGDIVVLYTDWRGTIAGKEERSRAIEVVRRQPDGTWLLIVGDPNGRD
jgi:ketosteroid isomerase-like protein